MAEAMIMGLGIAKHVFHVHGADGWRQAKFRKRISRGKLLGFFAAQPRALEACGGARQLTRPPTKFGGRRSPL